MIAALAALPRWQGMLLAGVLGAILGSYIATMCLRWPDGRGAATGRSACDHCGRALAWHELVPLLSALASRGRCRGCGGAIDPLHWQVELLAALIGIAAFGLLDPAQALGIALLGWLLLPLAILDWRHLWLPWQPTLLLALAGPVVGLLAAPAVPLTDRLIGGVLGFAVLESVRRLFLIWRKADGMGAGDPRLAGALALWIGWQGLPMLFMLGSLAGMLLLILRRAMLGDPEEDAAPFGTALAMAAPVAALFPLLPG